MRIQELHTRIMEIIEILELNEKNIKIMKNIKLNLIIKKIMQITEFHARIEKL